MQIKILFVDDEKNVLEQAEIFLERTDQDLEVHTTTSANESLEMMEDDDFDVILADYQMPEMNGLGSYMVKEIAETYDGSVEVKDSDLGGVRFDVRLKKI